MTQKETPLFKAFTWRDQKALDMADSFGNVSVSQENVAKVLAASRCSLQGFQGFQETARSITMRAGAFSSVPRVRRALDSRLPSREPR